VTARLQCVDWRSWTPERIAPLIRAEIDRWSATFDWDAAANFSHVEQGRALGIVRGWIVTDGDAVAGWCYYLLTGSALQVGGFTATTAAVSALMSERVFAEACEAGVETTTFFAYADAPGLVDALQRANLAVDRYWYLGRDLVDERQPSDGVVRSWRHDDVVPAAELFMRSYEPSEPSRPFAPTGTDAEWLDYVVQLTLARGCGDVMPDACVVVPNDDRSVAAVAIVSRINAATAHLVQLAVDPRARRSGLGAAVLRAASAAAQRAGCRRMTLLVSERNTAARRLYDARGFTACTSVLGAGSIQPLRLTSVAGGGTAASLR